MPALFFFVTISAPGMGLALADALGWAVGVLMTRQLSERPALTEGRIRWSYSKAS